jgi:plasmid maintenance system antidote protein VapI
MALRVEKAFGPKMEHLMRMQLAYDLAGVYCGGAPYFTPIRQKSFDFKGIEE